MECLVTKLKGVVENDSLVKLDEIKLGCTGSSGTSFLVLYWVGQTNACSVRLRNTTFSDGTKEKTFSANTSVSLTINNSLDAEIYIGNKYELQEMTFRYDAKLLLDTSYLRYMSSLENNISLRVAGNLEDYIFLRESYGKVNMINVLGGKSFVGDVSQLIPVASALKEMVIEGTGLTGNITEVLKMATNLNSGLVAMVGSNDITLGDISQISHDKVLCIDAGYHIASWKTNRASERKIIALNNVTLNNDVDAMLINQSACQIGYSNQSDSRYKAINVWGTRTSASDAAVASLKAKGYNVTINGIPM